MHVVLLLRVPSDVDAATSLLAEVGDARFPAALAVPADLVGAVANQLSSLRERDDLEWVRTGYSEPWFPMLPAREIRRQLTREAAALESAGLSPGPLWVTGPWDPHLPSTVEGVSTLLLGSDTLEEQTYGVVSHLDYVLPVLPVVPLPQLRMAPGDAVVVVELPPGASFTEEATKLAATPGCDLTTAGRFVRDHLPRVRHRPVAADWEPRPEAQPDLAVLHRKLVRLVTRVPERMGDTAELAVLDSQRGSPFSGGDVLEAQRALIVARTAVDQERRRGDDWGKVTRLDWDADGRVETHMELPSLSIVSAPHRSASLPLVDVKNPPWPISSVPGEPGWELCRWVTDLESGEATPIELVEDRVTELRGGAVVLEMHGTAADGSISVTIEASERRIAIRYALETTPPGWIGPELRVLFEHAARIRVDGSEWREVAEPMAIAGHKIRITDGEMQVLISSITPTECFVRPGIEGSGLVVWPHWACPGSGSYEISVDLAI
jgi:hypothetical protein